MSFLSIFRHLLMSILLAALAHTHAFPVRVSDTQWYTHTVCLHMRYLPCHWRAKLMPFNIAYSSAKLICWAPFSGWSQQESHISPKLLGLLKNWHWFTCSAPGHPCINLHGLDHPAVQNPWSQHPMLEEGVPHLIIPVLHDQTCSSLEYSTSHAKPTTHQVPNNPPTQWEDCPLHNNIGNNWSYASLLPP